jgi:predicted peptidase
MQIGPTLLEYEVVLPQGYDPGKAYPAVLAFSGGPQTTAGNQRVIATTFRDQAERRGYIVVMPAAPQGRLFYNGSERLIPAFLHQIQADYRIKGGKFRVAGQSNGGISAFEVASTYPQYFVSITGFPGYLLFPTPEHIAAISKLCIHMFVGENDERGFGQPMQEQASEFRKRRMAVTYHVEPGQGHGLVTLTGAGAARLFDQFEQDQRGCMRDR